MHIEIEACAIEPKARYNAPGSRYPHSGSEVRIWSGLTYGSIAVYVIGS